LPDTELEMESRFTDLYAEHYPRVFAYLISRAGRQIAEEAASDTFAVAWRRFAELPAVPLPWLLGVARNVLRESYRARLRSEALTAELHGWAQEAADDVADGVVERAQVLYALSELSDDDTELLTLLAWHGLTTGEAAQVLGCTKATFFVRLHRARRRLERVLAVDDKAPGFNRRPHLASEGNVRP
jgi:RNA polymerase sigma-70 factor (ECF subfamily)